MELTNEQIARYACMPCVDKLDETMAWMAGEVLKTRAERDALAAEVEQLTADLKRCQASEVAMLKVLHKSESRVRDLLRSAVVLTSDEVKADRQMMAEERRREVEK